MPVIGDFTSTATKLATTGLGSGGLSNLSKTAIAVLPPPQVTAGDRVMMAQRGASVLASRAGLAAAKAAYPGGANEGGTTGRGFLIALGTLSGREFSPAAMRQTLSQIEQTGFDAGAAAFKAPDFALTQAGNPTASSSEPMTTGKKAAIAAAVVGVAALGAILYKRRK